MKIIVGLGNPGNKYQGTRHNIGWEVLAKLQQRYSTSSVRSKFSAELAEAIIEGERALLLCPLTYMNRSGESVQPARDFYKIENSDILIICDDFNLPAGRIRVRKKGSAGGQKGLSDVIRRLGGDDVPRLRIGIGTPPPRWEVSDFVLSKFTEEERPLMDKAVTRSLEAVACWAQEGIQACMNRYNADPTAAKKKAEQDKAKKDGNQESPSSKTDSNEDEDHKDSSRVNSDRAERKSNGSGDPNQ